MLPACKGQAKLRASCWTHHRSAGTSSPRDRFMLSWPSTGVISSPTSCSPICSRPSEGDHRSPPMSSRPSWCCSGSRASRTVKLASVWRTDISWKVACGLPLTDEGFHPTVLTLWRNRLRASDRPQRIFDAVREVITQTNVLHGRNRRVLDSTVLDDAVTTQDAVMQLVTAIRRVRREIPEANALLLDAHDYDTDPGKPHD